MAEHSAAPGRRGAADPVTGGWSSDAAAVARAARTAGRPAGVVRVQGEGVLAEAVRALVDRSGDEDGGAATGGPREAATVVVDVDPTASSVTAALSTLGADGVVLVAGRIGRLELDVQTDVHRRGATVAGVPAPQDGGGQDG